MRSSLQPLVLFVDDEEAERKSVCAGLGNAGFEVECVKNASQARGYLERPVDVLLSKLKLNGNGLRFVETWRRRHPGTPVVTIVPQGGVNEAVAAMRLGVTECLPQPIDLLRLTECLRKHVRPSRKGSPGSGSFLEYPKFGEMVAGCAAMQEVTERARLVAPTESTVLITGSTGTGKELMADAIHRLSARSGGPFVPVNIAAVPDSLIESELFGHVKGAFTDAASERVGRFEAACGGTLFIDEIGDLRLESQAKLLRVLETQSISRVGSNESVDVDVRIVAATSRNLTEMLRRAKFREDLYYRLNVVEIQLPDVRERREDIPLLVRCFLDELARKHRRPRLTVDRTLADFFESYDWPGNIRELKNCLESMVVMSGHKAVLTKKDVPWHLQRATEHGLRSLPLGGITMKELERAAIRQTLDLVGWHRDQAADMLGLSARTLQRKLNRWREEGRYDAAP